MQPWGGDDNTLTSNVTFQRPGKHEHLHGLFNPPTMSTRIGGSYRADCRSWDRDHGEVVSLQRVLGEKEGI